MKTVIEKAGEVLDRMAPDDHCREPYWTATDEELERFAELVRADAIADEREACAKVCDVLASKTTLSSGLTVFDAADCADAIRDKGNT